MSKLRGPKMVLLYFRGLQAKKVKNYCIKGIKRPQLAYLWMFSLTGTNADACIKLRKGHRMVRV